MKYPGESEYNAYLASNGGFSNAYTDLGESLVNAGAAGPPLARKNASAISFRREGPRY